MIPLIDHAFDGHVHTRLCNHAVGEMAEYVEQAVQRGLTTIVFLEHLETAIAYEPRCWLSEADFGVYFEEGIRLKNRWQGVIDVRLGVETGVNREELATIEKRLTQYPFERVGLSCHFHRHGEVHFNLLSRRKQSLDQLAAIGADTVISAYFDALIEAVATIPCDVLCHMDAVLRHLPGVSFHDGHRRQIIQLLDGMRARNVALEINTSGFDYRGSAFPAPWIITEALKRGIPLQAGSDAHQPGDVGRYFAQLPQQLEALRP